MTSFDIILKSFRFFTSIVLAFLIINNSYIEELNKLRPEHKPGLKSVIIVVFSIIFVKFFADTVGLPVM